jgi:arsenate reductase
MTDKTVIWHNPRCSKSRAALELLRENGCEPEIIEYLKTPPTADEIAQTLRLLKISPLQLMRTKELIFKELNLSNDAEYISAMAEHPILIERPIVIRGGQARLGRPPEVVLEILTG